MHHDLDWGGGLFSNMHFPLNISPPPPPLGPHLQSPQRMTLSLVMYRRKYPELAVFFPPKERQQDDLSSRRQQTAISSGERTCYSVCVRL